MLEEQLNARLSDLRRAARDSRRRIEWEEISRGERPEAARRRSIGWKSFGGQTFKGHGLQHVKWAHKSLEAQE